MYLLKKIFSPFIKNTIRMQKINKKRSTKINIQRRKRSCRRSVAHLKFCCCCICLFKSVFIYCCCCVYSIFLFLLFLVFINFIFISNFLSLRLMPQIGSHVIWRNSEWHEFRVWNWVHHLLVLLTIVEIEVEEKEEVSFKTTIFFLLTDNKYNNKICS